MTTKNYWFWTSKPDWWEYISEGVAVLKDDAPEEAKKNYEEYLEYERFRRSLTLSDDDEEDEEE